MTKGWLSFTQYSPLFMTIFGVCDEMCAVNIDILRMRNNDDNPLIVSGFC